MRWIIRDEFVAASISCGQQARRKDLQTLGSLYWILDSSPRQGRSGGAGCEGYCVSWYWVKLEIK